jgi:hypothetical protein
MSRFREPIHITLPGCPGDPRANVPDVEGVVSRVEWRVSLPMLREVMDEFRF